MKSKLKISSLGVPCLLLIPFLFVPVQAFAAKDACSIVTAADAEAAIGEPVRPPVPASRNGGQGDGSECKFRSTQGSALKAKSVSVTVHYTNDDVSGSNTKIADSLTSAGYKSVQQVSGVGDSAIWGTMSMMGNIMGELTVLKGKHTMVIILIKGLPDATSLDHAKVLAAKILPRT